MNEVQFPKLIIKVETVEKLAKSKEYPQGSWSSRSVFKASSIEISGAGWRKYDSIEMPMKSFPVLGSKVEYLLYASQTNWKIPQNSYFSI